MRNDKYLLLVMLLMIVAVLVLSVGCLIVDCGDLVDTEAMEILGQLSMLKSLICSVKFPLLIG